MRSTRSSGRRRSVRPPRRAASAAPSETRRRLLEVACRLFADRGVDAVSVRDVCTAAGANVAAVAYHFGGKEGLHLEALRTALRTMHERTASYRKPNHPDPTTRLLAHLASFAACLLGAEADSAGPRMILRELARPSAALRRVAEEFMRPNFDELRAHVAALAAPMPPAELDLHVLGAVALFVHCRTAAPVVRLQLGLGDSYPPDFPVRAARHAAAQLFLGVGRADLLPRAAEIEA
jgi:AcrR family transcriptional regulator